MGSKLPVIALTSGEPAGIGPELCAMLSAGAFAGRLVVIGDERLLAERARMGGVDVQTRRYARGALPVSGAMEVAHVPLGQTVRAGHLDPANARHVLAVLDRAIDGCLAGEFDAMVTAPVHKGVINDAGIAFTGHTEYLAERTHVPPAVMMLVGGGLRVALATTHLALAEVARAIRPATLKRTLRTLDQGLREQFGIARPRILVAGLNPHSGEGGHLGREEIEVIAPVVRELRAAGLELEGPLPADTIFLPERLKGADCVLAMYHDQGLPVLKYASFGGGVNVTLGLPIVRTSVDHGTALDLAGTGRADPGSLEAALRLALEIVGVRMQTA